MKTILNYSGPMTAPRRGTVLGKVSMVIAGLVVAVPFGMGIAGMLFQRYFSMPRTTSPLTMPTTLVLVLIPGVLMILLPVMGLALGAWGIRMGKRECQYAVAGMLVNAAALLAALLVMVI